MCLGLVLHGPEHSDMTLVDTFLRIPQHKFDWVSHCQSGSWLMEDSGLSRLRKGESAVYTEKTEYLQKLHRR